MSNFTRPISGRSNRTGFVIYLLAICVEREKGERGDRRRNGGGGDGERKERSDKGRMKKATAR